MKRLFDIVASGCGLLVLSPVFLVVAICIKLDSRGSVFYRQVRVGYKNKDAFHLFENEVTLPLHTRLTDEDVEYVIGNFVEILNG